MNVVELIVFVLNVVFDNDSNGLLFIQFAYIVIVSLHTSFWCTLYLLLNALIGSQFGLVVGIL